MADASTRLFVVGAPSGTGKTTLLRLLLERVERMAFSVSHTTRAQRPGEVDGRDTYDYIVVNDALEGAYRALESVILAERHRRTAQEGVVRRLLRDAGSR